MITVNVPGDKSISHRALMLAPLANGTSRIVGLAPGGDVRATATAMRRLGVTDSRVLEGGAPLEIVGPTTLRSPGTTIDCGNSGTTARLLIGLIAGHPITARLDGDTSLRRRPMDRVLDPLSTVGLSVRELGEPGRLPLEVTGSALRAIEHESPVASAQVKSALLLAGLAARVPVSVVEPAPTRDHTERLLRAMGIDLRVDPAGSGRRVSVTRVPENLRPLEFCVPGDFSSAAYFIALAVLGGAGSGLRLERVGLNPGRIGFLSALEAMGANVEVVSAAEQGGETVGDIVARPSHLSGVDVPAEWVPRLLDEIPILACVAACAEGTTGLRGAAELRVKESDRLAALSRNLSALGVRVSEHPGGLEIAGTPSPLAGRVSSDGDHRIAMAFGVLGALPGSAIEIDDPGCVEVSYPGFWDRLLDVQREAGVE